GSENGWVRAWLLPQREYFDEGSVNKDGTARLWTEEGGVHPLSNHVAYIGLTGYIWHSFLETVQEAAES
ncbi:MAG: hypothetical protein PHI98_16785, partial [Eubacteriales bacterium]|nr:hypothetical protein [Eubacteriales bacterium]